MNPSLFGRTSCPLPAAHPAAHPASRLGALLLACSLACGLASGAALAQTEAAGTGFETRRVEIRGTAIGSLSARQLLTSVDSLGGEALQDAAVSANWELFGRLPGLNLTNFNQGTSSGKVSLRGFNGEGEVNAVKLLIDGVPSNSNDGNMPYLDLAVPLGLQAITVVRGTNDARHGLHNVAGNLELLTRQGGHASEMRLSAGPWGKVDAQFVLDRESGGFTQNYALGLRHADGWRDHAGADRHSLSAQWGYSPAGQDLRYSAALRLHRAEAEEPGYLTDAQAAASPRWSNPAVSGSDGGERLVGQASASVEGGLRSRLSWRALVYVNRYDDRRWVRFSAAASQQERDTDEVHRGARLIVSWRPEPLAGLHRWALEGGLDTERQRNASQRYSSADRLRSAQTRNQFFTVNNLGGFVQAVIEPTAGLKLVPAWRVDRFSGRFDDLRAGTRAALNDYGAIHQPKLSAQWQLAESSSVYANWGRSFQIGVGSAGYKNSAASADAQASVNNGTELGWKFAWARWLDGRVALWQQKASGEFYRQLNSNNGDSINIGATRRRGADLQLRAQVSPTLQGHATLGLQRATIVQPRPGEATLGKEIDHVPHRLYSAGLDWQAQPALQLSAWLQGQSSYWLERSNALTGRYGAFNTWNASASWTVSPRLTLDAQLLNANGGRREYVWWDGAQALHSAGEPRSLTLGLRAAF